MNVEDIVTRQELSEYVGAGGDGCFIHTNNEVVGIAMNPRLNPDAPGILLVGKGPRREIYAVNFLEDGDYVPTFVKQGTDQWKYMGDFRAVRIDRSEATIAEQSQRSGRKDIWGVMYLEQHNGVI